PKAGSDAASLKTYARRTGRDFVLNGEKRFITNGGIADFLFVFAVTDRSKPSTAGLSCFVVPRESRGLEVVKAYGLLGMHGANVVHLRFRNMRVSEDNVVGGIKQGFQIHGGIGYTRDLPIERYFRDARFMMIGGGTSEIMRFLIQREIYQGRTRRSC